MIRRIYIAALTLFAAILSGVCLSIAQAHVMGSPETLTYPPLSYSPPKAERVALANGIILYLIEDNELPLINISAVARMGS
ncbi:MAG: hypothetical protein RBS82_13075, partial [Syntrophales bacterium]|nr:hypothetical protein [Syntrophales bacterium]